MSLNPESPKKTLLPHRVDRNVLKYVFMHFDEGEIHSRFSEVNALRKGKGEVIPSLVFGQRLEPF